jgi:hypothetical protein
MKRYLFTNLVLLFLLISCTGWREQWTPIPGGEDLIGDDSWKCRPGVKVVDHTLIAENTGDIFTIANTSGPHFQIQGDFGVSTTIEVATDNMAAVSLFGRLRDGRSWWEGISRIDLGLEAGQVAVDIMGGTGFIPSVSERFPAENLSGPVELALRKIGAEFVVMANGKEVGRLADPGIFPDDIVYLGITVHPGNILTIHDLSVETERGQAGNIQMITPSPAAVPHYTPSDPP